MEKQTFEQRLARERKWAKQDREAAKRVDVLGPNGETLSKLMQALIRYES